MIIIIIITNNNNNNNNNPSNPSQVQAQHKPKSKSYIKRALGSISGPTSISNAT